MVLALHLTWLLMTVLRFAGVIMVFTGVAVFGVYFIGGTAKAGRAGDSAIPRSSWLGAGPKRGIRIAAVGVVMLVCAFAISQFMPNGT